MKWLFVFAILFSGSSFAANCITADEARDLAWPALPMSEISNHLVSFEDTLGRGYSFNATTKEYRFT